MRRRNPYIPQEEYNEMIENVTKEIASHKRSEESLRKLEALEYSILNAMPYAVIALREQRIIFANEAVKKVFGWTMGEVIGKSQRIFYRNEEEYEEKGRRLYTLLEGQGFYRGEVRCRHKDGKDICCAVNATFAGDRLEGKEIVVIYEDVTERERIQSEFRESEKKLERASAEWRATFDAMPHGVLLFDEDFKIIKANNYFAEMYGISFRDLVGKNCCELDYGSAKPLEFFNMLRAHNISGPQVFEYFDKNLNKYFLFYETPILDEDGAANAHVSSVIDISGIKNEERRLAESKDAFFNMLKELDFSYKELKGLYDSLIRSFVNAIDAKSPWTKGHSERVTHYSLSIARGMRLREREIEKLRTAALLHDIGKIGTYDVILDKPGKLTEDEFALIRMHPARGEEILKPIKQFRDLLPVIRHHHERIDGKGYPDGLKESAIPLLSKIISVADSFDSMTSDRPYRPSPPKEYAVAELRRCSGTQFDPQAVEAFLRFLEKSESEFPTNSYVL